MASYKKQQTKTGKSYCITTRKQKEEEENEKMKIKTERKERKPRNIIKKRGKYEPKLFQLFKLF